MSIMRGFDAAQRAWDNMSPPEDGPTECMECGGSGTSYSETCPTCGGSGYVDEDGFAFDPDEAERARDEYAAMKRDERLVTYRGGVDPEDDE